MKRYKFIGTIEDLRTFGYEIQRSPIHSPQREYRRWACKGEGRDRLFIDLGYGEDATNKRIEYNDGRRDNEEIDRKLILDLLFNDLVEEFEEEFDVDEY